MPLLRDSKSQIFVATFSRTTRKLQFLSSSLEKMYVYEIVLKRDSILSEMQAQDGQGSGGSPAPPAREVVPPSPMVAPSSEQRRSTADKKLEEMDTSS